MLSITEKVIIDGENAGPLPTSVTTNLTSRDHTSNPEFSSTEPWTGLYECSWFRSLVWLIYLQSLVTAANLLYIFPFSGASSDLKQAISFFLGVYLGWFGLELIILLLFTITSLSLCHAQDNSESRWTWRAQKRANWCLSKRRKLSRRILLMVSALILTASSATFGFAFTGIVQ